MNLELTACIPALLAFLLAPLLRSAINRTKARFAGRRGPPWLQPYRDLAKLAGKGAVYSTTTSWLFRAGPVVGLATLVLAAAIVPFAGIAGPVRFEADLIVFAYALALGRLFVVLAALDTGSAFEGMGASREAQLAALAEPGLLLALVALGGEVGSYSLASIYQGELLETWATGASVMLLCVLALLVIALTENSRIPVDDPTTHLELTMIHEVMVLDHSGPDLALIEYAQALKLWLFLALVVGAIAPIAGVPAIGAIAIALATMLLLGAFVGVIESTMARLRLTRVPDLVLAAAGLGVLAILLEVT